MKMIAALCVVTMLALTSLVAVAVDIEEVDVAKNYRYTNVCFEQDNDLDGSFNEDPVDYAYIDNDEDGAIDEDPFDGIDNDEDGAIDEDPAEPFDNDEDGLYDEDGVDCPDGTYLGDALPMDAEGNYLLEAVVKKNGMVSSYNPGQYYAVSTVNVLEDVDTLTIEENFCPCGEISALSPEQGGGSVVIVQVGPDDEVAYQILDAKSEEVTVDGCTVTAELGEVKAGTTILMYVKFGPALKGETWAGPYYCENTNAAWVSIGGVDSELEVASATLGLILKE